MTDFGVLDSLHPLPPDELPRQWVLTRDAADVPQAWESRERQGWILGADSNAKVCALRTSDGSSIGWIIEPLVQLSAGAASSAHDDLVLPIDAGAAVADVERGLYGRDHAGRSSGCGVTGTWVAIVLSEGNGAPVRRVYLGASHSVVFAPEHRVVATTHNLVRAAPRDIELSRAFDPLATKSYFTFGLTPFVGLHRLLPNHYLDLDTFEVVRHWPLDPLEPLTTGADGAVAVVEHCRRLISGLLSDHRAFRIFLSAGNDSRAVLALMRPFVDGGVDVLLETSVGRDFGSQLDVRVARQLSRIAALPHRITKRPTTRDDAGVMRAFVRVGESRSGKSLSAPGLRDPYARVPEDRFALAGMAGETGRAFYWKHGPVSASELSPELLVERTRSPATKVVLEAAADWLAGAPSWMSATNVLDLAYIEQRLGCWESPSRYLFFGRPLVASPMASAYSLETMLRLPEAYRAAGLMQRDMVAFGWPALLRVPFNTPTGLLRVRRDITLLGRRAHRRLRR